MSSLFEKCCSQVLCSPCLLDRASLHLPRGVSYFLLYLAVETGNQLAVKKLVEKWPHGDLSLDFVSESWLCRRRLYRSPRCLEPHEYMGVFGSYARYSSLETVSSLLEGVFYNLYHYHGVEGAEHVGLRRLDMSAVVINPQQIPLLLNLVRGTVPVTHHSDYLSDREAKTMGISRPHLQDRGNQVAVEGQPPLDLFVNLLLDNTTSGDTVTSLCEVFSFYQWVKVKLKGVHLLELTKESLLKQLHAVLDVLIDTGTDHIFVSDPFEWKKFVADPSRPPSLWAYCRDVHRFPIRLDARDLLFITPQNKGVVNGLLSLLKFWKGRRPRAFCLLCHSDQDTASNIVGYGCAEEDLLSYISEHLSLFLEMWSSSLEYLQLCHWSLYSTHLDTLKMCSKLRVLSIAGRKEQKRSYSSRLLKNSVSEVLTAVSALPQLEFFQWEEHKIVLDITDLCCIHDFLQDCFRPLGHFHVCVSDVQLSEEDWEKNVGLLEPLRGGLEGKESENVQLMAWLTSLRPDVCFRLGSLTELSTGLAQAANMDHIPRVLHRVH